MEKALRQVGDLPRFSVAEPELGKLPLNLRARFLARDLLAPKWLSQSAQSYRQFLCFALVAAGKRDEAEAVRNELLRVASTSYVKEYFMANAHLALGYYDEALTSLEKAAAERDPSLVWLGTETKLDPLRQEPRFIEAFRSTNNPMAFV